MPDPRLTLIFAAKDLASREAGKLKGALGGVHAAAIKAGGGIRSATGHIANMGKTALFVAGTALAALAAGLLGATKAAADEQVGIVRLNQALKNNVKGFDGNTKAIEARIAAGEKLGFSDDAQRLALAQLLPVTHNVKKAQDLVARAMDLARAKSIDLATATVIIRKANEGNVGALKKVGITIDPVTKAMDKLKASHEKATPAQLKAAKAADKAATSLKILAAIQKASTGQAAKYGDTVDGMGEAIKITFGDIVEDLGAMFLPMMKNVFGFIRDTAIPALSKLVAGVSNWVRENQPLIAQIGGAFTTGIAKVGDVIKFIVPKVQSFADALFGKNGVAQSVGKVVGPIAHELLPKLGTLLGKFGDITAAVVTLVGKIWGDGQGPLAIAVKGIAGVFGLIVDVLSGPVAGVIENFLKGLNFIIGKVNDLLGLGDKHEVGKIPTGYNGKGGTGGSSGGRKHTGANATGGFMAPGGVYSVGERPGRREDVVVGPGGAMVYSGNAGKGGGGGVHLHVHSVWPPTPAQVREMAKALDHDDYFRSTAVTGNRT